VIKKQEIMIKPNFAKQFKFVVRHEVEEPEKDYAMHYFYELYVGSIFYNSMLHSFACEQSARMNAMENASKNAGEILEKLTLLFNKVRQ